MRRKAKTNAETDLGPTDLGMDAVQADVAALRSDAGQLANDVGGVARNGRRFAIRTAQDMAGRALRVSEETAAHLARDAQDWGNENLASVRETVRVKPIKALAVSAGIGALFGAIFLRS